MLDLDHESKRAPSDNDHEGHYWDLCNMHDHDSSRVERVRTNVFWGESKSGCTHSLGLLPDDGDDI